MKRAIFVVSCVMVICFCGILTGGVYNPSSGTIDGGSVSPAYNPTNYTPTSPNLDGYLEGIDDEFGVSRPLDWGDRFATNRVNMNQNALTNASDIGTEGLTMPENGGTHQATNFVTISNSFSFIQTGSDGMPFASNDGSLLTNISLKSQDIDIFQTSVALSPTYSITSNDYFLKVDSLTNTFTITLSTNETFNGRDIIVKDISGNASSNNITVQTEGSALIDGTNTFVLDANYEATSFRCDGTNWFIY